MNYYVKIRGQILGPFTKDNVLDMIKQGRVGKSSMVSTDRQTWRKAEEFEEIFPKAASAAVTAFVQQKKSADVDMSKPIWLVSRDGQTIKGPCAGTVVINLIQKGVITPNTFVWEKGEKMLPVSKNKHFEHVLAQQKTELEDFNAPILSVPQPAPEIQSPKPATKRHNRLAKNDADKINVGFYWFYGLTILAIVSLILSFFFSALCEGSCEEGLVPSEALTTLGYIFSIVFYVSYFSSLILTIPFVYHVWRVVPPDNAFTTPNKAAWFLLLPLFNLGWQFIAFGQLAKNLNKSLDERISLKRASVGACLFYCVMNIIAFGIPNLIVAPFAFNTLRKASVELVELSR